MTIADRIRARLDDIERAAAGDVDSSVPVLVAMIRDLVDRHGRGHICWNADNGTSTRQYGTGLPNGANCPTLLSAASLLDIGP